MARRSLAALVGDELASGTEVPGASTPGLPDFGANEVTEAGTSEAPKPRTSNSRNLQTHDLPNSQSQQQPDYQAPEVRDSVPSGVPKYLRLIRKEARLSAEQFDSLTDLARRLNRRKPAGVGERITENTLIRIAVERLLVDAERLNGTTEEELFASLT